MNILSPRIKYAETFYQNVAASTEQKSTGVTPNEGEHLTVYRFTANGADPSCYVALIWDRGGDDEKIFSSTKGDVDLIFESDRHDLHFVGDGEKKLQICIINDNDTQSPIIGGSFEVIEVD